jgi:hypothetical protein
MRDGQEIEEVYGAQPHHLLCCDALGLDCLWYEAPDAQKKTGGAFRPLKRGVPRFSECYPLVISAILLYITYSNPTSS